MKKYLSLFLIAITTLSFISCVNKNSDSDISSESIQSESVSISSESEGISYVDGEGDISVAVDGSTTSKESPVPFGEWAAVPVYSNVDKTYHTVYIRLTKVTTMSEDAEYIQTAVDFNNEHTSGLYYVDFENDEDFELPEGTEFCLLDYEVYVPEDFPRKEGYSIQEGVLTVLWDEYNTGEIIGGQYETNFELIVYDDGYFEQGNTYGFKTLFKMFIDYEDYGFYMSSYPDGFSREDDTVDSSEIIYWVYFASH